LRFTGGGEKTIAGAPVDLNTATLKQLEELPGVGPVTAHAILDFREKSGPFKSVNDLLVIPRISKKKLEKIRPYVFVKPEPPAKKPATPPARKHATAFYLHRQNSNTMPSASQPATSAASRVITASVTARSKPRPDTALHQNTWCEVSA
jgi:competence protein ComEA